MAERICPWWLGYFLASPVRKLWQNPGHILKPYVREGMTVLEPGPGMGFFTLELARLSGSSGKVVAVDVQPRMLQNLKRRLAKRGLSQRVETRLANANSMGIADLSGRIDFALAFAVVHEFPDVAEFFAQVSSTMKPGAKCLLAEPRGHVQDVQFAGELEAAARRGLRVVEHPAIPSSHAAILQKE
jgi:ubiquinone/menaquinone biosynthesis C-methylase UbiE